MWLPRVFFSIDRWLPADWPELDVNVLRTAVKNLASQGQDLSSSTSRDTADQETRIEQLRTACCLFWHQFYHPEQFSAEQLQDLRTNWRYEYTPDEPPDWTRAYMSIHIAEALVLHLNKTEVGYSELLRDTISEITRLASYLKSSLQLELNQKQYPLHM